MTRWTVTLADGTPLGTVQAATREEALGRAIVLAARSGRTPQALSVARTLPAEGRSDRSLN
jgi:hypothetical protein